METIHTDNYASLETALPRTQWLQNLMLRGARNSVLEMLQKCGAHSVLDVCSGAGVLAHMIQQRGMKVQAVDGSPTMAGLARSRYGILSRVIEAQKMNYQRQFDAAVIGLALHEMDEESRQLVWQRMAEAVKNTGIIIAIDYALPEQPTLLSNLTGRVIAADERSFEGRHPQHHQNYQAFMQDGGLLAWLKRRNSHFYQVRHHLFNNLVVAAVVN